MKLKNLNRTGLLIIGVAVVVLYAATIKVSQTNFACGTCHTPEHARWVESTHKSVDCTECHLNPGLAGNIDGQGKVLRWWFATVTGWGVNIEPHEDPIPIATANCKRWHSAIFYFNELGFDDLPETLLETLGLRMAHRVHIEQNNMNCVDCHRGIVHRDPADVGTYTTNWPLMYNDCGKCHNGEHIERFDKTLVSVEDFDQCLYCHPMLPEPPGK